MAYALDDAQARQGVLMLERQLGDLMKLQRAVSVASEVSWEGQHRYPRLELLSAARIELGRLQLQRRPHRCA